MLWVLWVVTCRAYMCMLHVYIFITSTFLNVSLETSVIPRDWKLAKVTPIYKEKGDRSDVGNYRPISCIGHIPKIFEREIHQQLLHYFQENKYISIDQSAFLKQHNTQTALHRVIDDCIDNICSSTYTGICSFDIKKCFDTIDHDLLLIKMKYYGICNNELEWFKTYLSKRSQIVKCNGNLSDVRNFSVGVPQGSVLGPFLFVIFINDISQNVGLGTANLFADDTLIYCHGNTENEVNEKLQSCVNIVSDWYEKNNIVINADKSCCMLVRSRYQNCNDNFSISIGNSQLKSVESMNYLGLEIEKHLSWNKYVDKLCKKLAFKISRLSRLRKSTPKNILIMIYNSTVQTCIDYSISVWGCTGNFNIDRVQRFQNYAARIIENNFDYVNTRGINLVKKLGWMNVRQRLLYFQTLLIFKSIHGLAPEYLNNNVIMDFEISKKITRKHNMNLYLPFPECQFQKNMLFYRGARDWNALPGHIKDCHELDKFKKVLKYYIKNR